LGEAVTQVIKKKRLERTQQSMGKWNQQGKNILNLFKRRPETLKKFIPTGGKTGLGAEIRAGSEGFTPAQPNAKQANSLQTK
jgi:hypothetical protein